jgi:hypothetical protein
MRRRTEYFRVLAGITELLPRSGDTEGCAKGSLGVVELAAHVGVSRKAARRALEHWREWRVLWLYWKGGRVWDIRFERAFVEALLSSWKNSPWELGRMLMEHQRQRFAVAPRRT